MRMETERLIIRPLVPADAEAVLRYRSHREVRRYQGWEPRDAGEVRAFLEGMAEGAPRDPGRWFQLGLEDRATGEIAGDIGLEGLDQEPGQMEIGVTLAPEFQRRGLAAEALRAVLRTLFEERGVHRVVASVDPRNTRSLALFTRLGMRREAHHVESLWFKGEWVDDVIFALLRREFTGLEAPVTVRTLEDRDRAWVRGFVAERWGAETVVARGVVHRPHELQGFVAAVAGEMRAGLVTYAVEGGRCEVVSLDAVVEGRGVGTALLEAVGEAARAEGCSGLWLITTNDNLRALRFYQRRGLELVAVHRGALDRSRALKPTIPAMGAHGIPLRDELELWWVIDPPPGP